MHGRNPEISRSDTNGYDNGGSVVLAQRMKVNQHHLLAVVKLVDAGDDAMTSRLKLKVPETLPSGLPLVVEERTPPRTRSSFSTLQLRLRYSLISFSW